MVCPTCGDSRIGLKITLDACGGVDPVMHVSKYSRTAYAYCMVCKSGVEVPEEVVNKFINAVMKRDKHEKGSPAS
jgi:hypothetical protein